MAKECHFCGKKPHVGGTIVHRGISKKAGGIGLKLVKTNKRVFKPNIQKVKAKINGTACTVNACTACIRTGLVVK
ncbi:ribosomal protein L28 [Lentisphaera araneosa HTCC2155]|uniref:Large ribosomal subunit protein bL28 n=1 Tax=Lentisphaera araneosa HTCC2155 TaxID=313628 RepID=A6DKH3_9BACT|nr:MULTISPECIES: 50S ribosomal protein L28 [Lentisphaera]EDM27871.1 ribosomal protein L28 [Lentisphaera araneosa HTCC2155]MDD7987131.1 50S ribosomal protein L28 [Lentisphaera marina]